MTNCSSGFEAKMWERRQNVYNEVRKEQNLQYPQQSLLLPIGEGSEVTGTLSISPAELQLSLENTGGGGTQAKNAKASLQTSDRSGQDGRKTHNGVLLTQQHRAELYPYFE